jgi:hypothetical protein
MEEAKLKSHIKVGFSLAAVAFIAAASFTAQAASPRVGEAVMCIDSNNIRNTQVVDTRTVLVHLSPGDQYRRIDMTKTCMLTRADGFAYSTSLPKLCKQDILRVIDTAQTCLIDQIVVIDKAEAKALQAKKR